MLCAEDLTITARLHAVSACLRPGEVTAICGPNGAGKSTLLAALAGLLAGDDSRVTLDGTALAALPARTRARTIGYLPQMAEVAWDMAVEVLVSLGRLPWGGAIGDEAVDQAIAAMQLEPLRHRPVSQLSGGERARVLLARVLAGEPQWLLADEPLANLDLGHGVDIMDRLKDQARAGAGVVVVLHDLASAMNHADRVLVLSGGTLLADGPPATVLSENTIAAAWGISARWLGEPGSLALSIGF